MPEVPDDSLDPIDKLRSIVQILRGPEGCPWDIEQTQKSLIPNILEEAYEAADAIRTGNKANIVEELGDLLLQVVMQSEIASESQEFSLEDMTYKYPTSIEEFKNINGVGEGKVNKFGNYFIKLIKEYIEDNQIQKPDELVLRTSGEKSSKKLSLIQNIDKKIPLDEISDSRGIEFTELLSELESIVFSGTKLDIDYYLEEILDEDQQEELKEYFLESESEDISDALEEFDGDYDEEELRLYRIKFLNDVSN